MAAAGVRVHPAVARGCMAWADPRPPPAPPTPRPEADFESLDKLVARIHRDAEVAEEALAHERYAQYAADTFLLPPVVGGGGGEGGGGREEGARAPAAAAEAAGAAQP